MANLKKIQEGPEGEGLKKISKRPDVTRKMDFAKKGKVMKAMAGKSVRGFGAARTSGMGLQDEQMVLVNLWIIIKLNVMNYGNVWNNNIRFKYRRYHRGSV